MIGAEEMVRAERILQIIYRDKDMPNQLRAAEVDLDAFGRMLAARTETIQKFYRLAWTQADPRLHAAYNTILMHMFLLGLVCGRDEGRVIE